MNEFNNIINSINEIGLDDVIVEHCKTGTYRVPFNVLELRILDLLYKKYLSRTNIFNKKITNLNDLLLAYYDKLPKVLEFLGDTMCKHISNNKTMNYTTTDVDKWAYELFNYIKNYIGD